MNTKSVYAGNKNVHFKEFITERDRDRIKCIKNERDKVNLVMGKALLHYGLNKYFNVKKDLDFCFNEFGKPYFKSHDIHFNISHSKDFVACAFSKTKVGVDIEWQGGKHERLIRFMHEEEQSEYWNISEKYRQKYFYDLWCLKESYLKYLGIGIGSGLDTFSIYDLVGNDVGGHTPHRSKCLHILEKINGYSMAVCVESDEKVKVVRIRNPLKLLER